MRQSLFAIGLSQWSLSALVHADVDALCADNPARCAEVRSQLEAKCAQDPVAREQKKAKLRERLQERRNP